jgi:hypothetical protein
MNQNIILRTFSKFKILGKIFAKTFLANFLKGQSPDYPTRGPNIYQDTKP